MPRSSRSSPTLSRKRRRSGRFAKQEERECEELERELAELEGECARLRERDMHLLAISKDVTSILIPALPAMRRLGGPVFARDGTSLLLLHYIAEVLLEDEERMLTEEILGEH